jgi:hypothetical protein
MSAYTSNNRVQYNFFSKLIRAKTMKRHISGIKGWVSNGPYTATV